MIEKRSDKEIYLNLKTHIKEFIIQRPNNVRNDNTGKGTIDMGKFSKEIDLRYITWNANQEINKIIKLKKTKNILMVKIFNFWLVFLRYIVSPPYRFKGWRNEFEKSLDSAPKLNFISINKRIPITIQT